jgi:iron-only hydrogenase group A
MLARPPLSQPRVQRCRRALRCLATSDKVVDLSSALIRHRRTKVMVAQVAPAVRVGIAEGFGLRPNQVSPRQLVSALRRAGFHYVFDTLFAADVTILEEGTELLRRLKDGELASRPMFTSCCPGWIALAEQSYPEVLPFISTTKSPQMIMGAIVKHVFAQSIGLEPSDVHMVSFMPCVRKQGEADREAFGNDTSRDVDIVVTTKDLIELLKLRDIDLPSEPECDFDDPLGESTGGAHIFGKSGGVMLAALRFAHFALTGETLGPVVFAPVSGMPGVSEASVTLTPAKGNPVGFPAESITLKVAVVAGLGGAKAFLKAVATGTIEHKFVEVMACAPMGCAGGAGNPNVGKDKALLEERKAALTAFDDEAAKKAAHENAAAKRLYSEYIGEPGGHVAHGLFHTHYEAKEKK